MTHVLFVLLVIAQVTTTEALVIPDECSSLEDGVCFVTAGAVIWNVLTPSIIIRVKQFLHW